jgi:hypothetical protein
MTIRTSAHSVARTHSPSTSSARVSGLYSAASASNRTLWAIQGILAVVFLFAGISKLVLTGEALTENSPFSVEFIRFIGICETLGAAGLVLPGAFGIRTGLAPLAAAGLLIIMVGAVVSTAATMGVAATATPFAVGLACAFVVHGRTQN